MIDEEEAMPLRPMTQNNYHETHGKVVTTTEAFNNLFGYSDEENSEDEICDKAGKDH